MTNAEENSTEVVLRLNQQQLELVDQTIGRTEAADRADLFRRALEEFHKERSS